MARSGNWITAGDGLGAFGAALILAVQVHLWASRAAAGQWIYAKPGHSERDLQLISSSTRFGSEFPAGRAAARENFRPSPSSSTRAKAQPPQSRKDSHACNPHTGPGAEGGGGWPMHATAQPWHAEGRPSPTGRTAETAGGQTLDNSARQSLGCSGFNFQILLVSRDPD
jgi:hypothetical protein